jgi:hypothetical protein
MNRFEQNSNRLKWIIPVLFAVAITGCGGKKTVLGPVGNPVLAPTVTAVTPANNATSVAVHNTAITATFNEAIASGASFVLTCTTPCVNPTGTVALDPANNKVVTFTPTANLSANTLYTATVDGAKSVASGLSQEHSHVWQFTTGIAPPPITVTAVAPAANTTGVSINNSLVTADFNEAIAPVTGTASFTLTCALPCVNPTGTVTRDATNRVAVLTLTSGTLLPSTVYTATIAGTTSLATGAPLVAPFVWHFTTGTTVDVTRPRVTFTVPATTTPGPTMNVPTNMAISATFSENMAPTSISATSFTLTCSTPCVNPAGNVSYALGSKTAVFTPTVALAANTTYTATITTAAADLAGNSLAGNQAPLPAASNYVWMFTTTTAAVAANVSVSSTNPMANSVTVCPGATINATFDVPSGLRMDPASVNSSTFTVTQAAPALTPVVATSVSLDPSTGRIASFNPMTDLVAGVTYTATLKSGNNGVKDAAIPANLMMNDFVWSFTAAACTITFPVIPLGSIGKFGTFGGSAGTTNEGIYTVVNGDIGTTAASTSVTGFHDGGVGCIYTETTLNVGTVNGNIYTATPSPTVACPSEGTTVTAAIAADARGDALTAYNALVAQAGGPDPGAGNLANLVLAPGVYTAALGSFMIVGGNLTLDAQGDTNAVWVFQMASTLTVGGPGAAAPQSIILINGAQSKNVFWQVGTAATINAAGGGTMVGTIISQAGANISTHDNVDVVTVNGRVISLNASVTMVNTVINVPAP